MCMMSKEKKEYNRHIDALKERNYLTEVLTDEEYIMLSEKNASRWALQQALEY